MLIQIFGKAQVNVENSEVLAYIKLIDKDNYIRERIQPYIDEILSIRIKNIINRGHFKDRDNLRKEGAKMLKEQGYDALFALAATWIADGLIKGPLSKRVILYNCDKEYWLFARCHRVSIKKLKELGLYDKETKHRFNTFRRKYTKMHLEALVNPVPPEKGVVAQADILVTYVNKTQILEGRTLAVALDTPGEIKLVYGRGRPESSVLIKASSDIIQLISNEAIYQSQFMNCIDSQGWSRTNNGGYYQAIYRNCPGYSERFDAILAKIVESYRKRSK